VPCRHPKPVSRWGTTPTSRATRGAGWSAHRLGTDHVDLFQMHRPAPDTYVRFKGAETVLNDAVLDRIDATMPPGTDVETPDMAHNPPACRRTSSPSRPEQVEAVRPAADPSWGCTSTRPRQDRRRGSWPADHDWARVEVGPWRCPVPCGRSVDGSDLVDDRVGGEGLPEGEFGAFGGLAEGHGPSPPSADGQRQLGSHDRQTIRTRSAEQADGRDAARSGEAAGGRLGQATGDGRNPEAW
jgi:hypothetical protein